MDIREYWATLGANQGYAEELFRSYQANPQAVSPAWRDIFANAPPSNGKSAGNEVVTERVAMAPPAPTPVLPLGEGDTVLPLRGAAARLVGNMQASLSVPTATSQRTIPVRLLEENRRQLNRHLSGRGVKISMTPLLAWAVVKAAQEWPSLNSAFTSVEGEPARVVRAHVNLGLAVDVERGSGRSLVVPVVKGADKMDFAQFAAACERLIAAARAAKLAPDDLQGATLSLTNPGTVGTRASVPRLMAGQAAIVAAGAAAYPPGFEDVADAVLRVLGVGKVVTLSCTYDHRVVQGAESGSFLARIHALLTGADNFYGQIFSAMGAPAPVPATPTSSTLSTGGEEMPETEAIRKQAAVSQLVHAYRVRGHLLATVDPLKLTSPPPHSNLELQHYGLATGDLDLKFLAPIAGGEGQSATMPLREILDGLRATYCGNMGCEYMHMQAPEERAWLQERLEPARGRWTPAPELRRRILRKLADAEAFEHLLHARFVGHKRFSLEGGEALMPALDYLFDLALDAGTHQLVLGMSHRGRLNVLVNTLGLSMSEMFSKFEDADPDSVEGSGDVKYHIGAEGAHTSPNGKRLTIELIPNPSHLEAVDPVTEGAARARQVLEDGGPSSSGRGAAPSPAVMPLLIHGDAAFAGQGIVAETLNLSELDGYSTGGTIHLVVNNQIGFTTAPVGARSSMYCTDVARMVQAPIFHVNGDDPEAMVRAVELAFGFRQKFHKDVVVDMVCYRRHGHNEADDPSLTQPVMYRVINAHPAVCQIYSEALVKEGLMSAAEAATVQQEAQEHLRAEAEQTFTPAAVVDSSLEPLPSSAAPVEALTSVGTRLCTLPSSFHLHPKLKTFMDRRRKAVAGQAAMDWSLAEALALGTLAMQGVSVRLTGEDTGRGTFSQRHAVLHDYEDGTIYTPLANLGPDQRPVEIYDSLLSEEAALGFEFGYSMTHPSALVVWEAQFGDFVNGAQVILDQFLAASLTKWGRTSGLTLLLPHGFEGQGPEHSSGRMERFLQLSAEENWRVVNATTAGQYFHLLRRQGLASGPRQRRPLVVFTPKSLLRHPEVATPIAELAKGGFASLLGDGSADPANVTRVLICSGKIYYELHKARRDRKDDNVAILRCEQLYPFPETELRAEVQRYAKACTWRWVQEEPGNMGGWQFVQPRLAALVPGGVEGITRTDSASPATGSLHRHQQEQSALIERALAE